MIACFPDAYPDELLYSLCARYSDRMQYPSEIALFRDLFGMNRTVSTLEVPAHLDRLVTQLPVEQGYTVDTIIDCHTLLPLYTPFLAAERTQLIRTAMQGEKYRQIAQMARSMNKHITTRYQLRFCSICVAEDRIRFGEAYWHRVHQAPGVEVCPIHMVFVHTSSMNIRNFRTSQHYFSAEALLTTGPMPVVQPIEPTNVTHQLLFALAQDVAWLLNHPHSVLGGDSIHARYLHLLSAQGFATRTGRLNLEALLTAFEAWYSAETRLRLQVPLQHTRPSAWPATLVRKPCVGQHPLRHLLMIQFLGHTVERFFQLPTDEAPFGHGPWPCLNPVCDHYHQRSIPAYQISYHQPNAHKPVGKFACACGFVYARRGPDRDPADQFRRTAIIVHGSVWETRLIELWLDATHRLRDIARLLGVSVETAGRHAQRLNLPSPRPGRPSRPPSVRKPLQGIVQRDAVAALLPTKRAAWLEIIKDRIETGAILSRGEHRKLYEWLGRHDRAWRDANMPLRVNYRGHLALHRPNYPAMWTARDAEYAPQICATAARIRASVPPERVTVTSLSRILFPGKDWFLSVHLDQLPRTAQIVAEETESPEQFQIRRIAWVATLYREEGHLPTRSQFERRAHVHKLRHQPPIRAAVDAAFHILEEALTEPSERTDDP